MYLIPKPSLLLGAAALFSGLCASTVVGETTFLNSPADDQQIDDFLSQLPQEKIILRLSCYLLLTECIAWGQDCSDVQIKSAFSMIQYFEFTEDSASDENGETLGFKQTESFFDIHRILSFGTDVFKINRVTGSATGSLYRVDGDRLSHLEYMGDCKKLPDPMF